MRKAQKQMALEFVQTLQEAHDEIENLIKNKKHVQAMDVLVQCQQGAIELGNFVEETAGEGTRAVVLLEKYCECVFQFYNELNVEKFFNVKINIRNLRNQIQEVGNSINQDIKVRKEVVFFPYNASMWDSLESVYLAAKEDPDCDAYCVPIPYYERNADGSLGTMHYEGKEFPKNIEVYSYLDYSLEERKPDVAYVHNPYDDWNRVTCIHPHFFSKNLKKYVEELIYIPYFVGPEIDPSDQPTIERMKHFCFTPVIMNADKVILQSENHRQVYINEYFKMALLSGLQGKHIERKALEQKFIAGGSPKFDKVLRTKKEDIDIPDEWLKLIQKEDGTWKKIIFYNTTIQAMLENRERMLEKIKYVLETFKDNRDEVVLLWRPHPLLEGTIKSMLPHLWEEYDAITRQYRKEGWGIWDDTTDMNRAVAISDAYYGDQSSVLQVYQKTGKPMMVQNVGIINRELCENICLLSRGAEFDDENGVMWLVTNITSMLLKIDLKTGELIASYQIPVERIREYNFLDVKKVGDNLYLPPYNADKMYCFSIPKECFSKIELPLSEGESIQNGKFIKIINIPNELYLIGFNVGIIIKMNLMTQEVSRIEGFGCGCRILTYDGIVIDNFIYLPLYEKNTILRVDTKDDSWEEIYVENNRSEGFVTITEVNKGLLLTDKKDNRFLYCFEEGRIVSNELNVISQKFPNHLNAEQYQQYCKVLYIQGKEYYFPTFESKITVIDKVNNQKKLMYVYPFDTSFETDFYSKFELIKEHQKNIYFQARTNGDIFVIDSDTDEIKKMNISISADEKKALFIEILKYIQKEINYENNIHNVNTLLVMVRGMQ